MDERLIHLEKHLLQDKLQNLIYTIPKGESGFYAEGFQLKMGNEHTPGIK